MDSGANNEDERSGGCQRGAIFEAQDVGYVGIKGNARNTTFQEFVSGVLMFVNDNALYALMDCFYERQHRRVIFPVPPALNYDACVMMTGRNIMRWSRRSTTMEGRKMPSKSHTGGMDATEIEAKMAAMRRRRVKMARTACQAAKAMTEKTAERKEKLMS
jgi:hypothetical protein